MTRLNASTLFMQPAIPLSHRDYARYFPANGGSFTPLVATALPLEESFWPPVRHRRPVLVMLILYRCHITEDFLGLLYRVDKGTICPALRQIEPLARKAWGVKRSIRVTKEEMQALVIDATEQPLQRPKHGGKRWYSGNKKRHSIKNERIITGEGRIVCAAPSMPGTVHDITIRRCGLSLLEGAREYADSGYREDQPDLEIRYKKTKKGKLSGSKKEYHQALSHFRVDVAHAIGRMKRLRILADRYRDSRSRHSTKFALIAGITNLVAGL